MRPSDDEDELVLCPEDEAKLENFRVVVRRFIDLLVGCEGLASADDLRGLVASLIAIAQEAERLPPHYTFSHAPNEALGAQYDKLARFHIAMSATHLLLRDHVERLCEEAQSIDDPETEQLAILVCVDLSELFADLEESCLDWEKGDIGSRFRAGWDWEFGWRTHWGEHLFRALHTLHLMRDRLHLW